MKFLSTPSFLKGISIGLALMVVFHLSMSVFSAIASEQPKTFWKYQCIDTMKISRDSARALMNTANGDKILTFQVQAIKNLGANCIALATPYDEEFVPYLQAWVKKARENNLHVWFRGNWSAWEGWFGYDKNLTPDQHIAKTKQFILSHPNLFADGDIFTPAVEAENGWPGNNAAGDGIGAYRNFLINQYHSTTDAFNTINKKVTVNWYSMSGGVAKGVLDDNTIAAIGGVVTLDHYVANVSDMATYIDEFKNRGAKQIVLGEFGAPIPDINGDMTEYQQADFVNTLFQTLYQYRSSISGINYWTLTDSSTALYNDNGQPRKVTDIIKSYFQPAIITGKVTDTIGNTVKNAQVTTTNAKTTTDESGTYRILVPSNQSTTLSITADNYQTSATTITTQFGQQYHVDLAVSPINPSSWYMLQYNIQDSFLKIGDFLSHIFQKN